MSPISPSSSSAGSIPQSPDPGSVIQHEYETQRALFEAQPSLVQRFMEAQARQLAEGILQNSTQMRFSLPDRVMDVEKNTVLTVPANQRQQISGGLRGQLSRSDSRMLLKQRLAELEGSTNHSVAISAALLRHATAQHMVYNMLPSGRTVIYQVLEGEEIPSMPEADRLEPESALTASTDAIAEETGAEDGRGELLVPYVPFARRFYIPKWVAFDDQDHLLVQSVSEAEAHVASLQRYVLVLHLAVGLAPYMVADTVYQQKRYGILGQLVNQGRALARYETLEIVSTIQRRANAGDLNRGLSLSLPFFDDQDLELKTHEIVVIPAGRIMFVPAFVVRAASEEQAKVAQDTRLNPSTRRHLLSELAYLEKAFVK
jgi:hypothetical protein